MQDKTLQRIIAVVNVCRVNSFSEFERISNFMRSETNSSDFAMSSYQQTVLCVNDCNNIYVLFLF